MDEQQNKINIEVPEELSQGTYSNLAMISHSPSEFVVDFISLMPGAPKARVGARIILTPQHAKRLLQALGDNVNRYEAIFGKIIDHEANASRGGAGGGGFFGGPTGQA